VSTSKIFVLIHGGGHGAWAFEKVAPYLILEGHAVIAPDLPGHGLNARFPESYRSRAQDPGKFAAEPSPLAQLTLTDLASAVTGAVRQVARTEREVILVGHSMAGALLNWAGEAVPELVTRLVYLSGWMTGAGKSFDDYFQTPEMTATEIPSLILANPGVVGAVRIDFGSADPAYRTRAKAAFGADVDDETWDAAAHLLTSETPVAVFTEPVNLTAGRWGALPRTYISCTRDRALPLAAQRRFISEADAFTPGNLTDVRELATSHSPFLSQPEQLARVLLEL
jgi:pimeloyl-ACP methyl ester carboxylesterase